jgi:hypothetical protein
LELHLEDFGRLLKRFDHIRRVRKHALATTAFSTHARISTFAIVALIARNVLAKLARDRSTFSASEYDSTSKHFPRVRSFPVVSASAVILFR